MTDLELLVLQAELHAANLTLDILNAASRQEDIRLRRLAIEAEQLRDDLRRFAEDSPDPSQVDAPSNIQYGTANISSEEESAPAART